MKSFLSKKVYSYIWEKDSMRRAEITFEMYSDKVWKFKGCKYTGTNIIYDLDDFDFLSDLALEIKELCKKEGVK